MPRFRYQPVKVKFLTSVLLFFVSCSGLPFLPLIMGMMNSRTTSNSIRPITTGKPQGLFLSKRVDHPKYGIRITTLPITRFCGTPCPVFQSVFESYSPVEGTSGHLPPLPLSLIHISEPTRLGM